MLNSEGYRILQHTLKCYIAISFKSKQVQIANTSTNSTYCTLRREYSKSINTSTPSPEVKLATVLFSHLITKTLSEVKNPNQRVTIQQEDHNPTTPKQIEEVAEGENKKSQSQRP